MLTKYVNKIIIVFKNIIYTFEKKYMTLKKGVVRCLVLNKYFFERVRWHFNIIYADPAWDFKGGGIYQDSGRKDRSISSQFGLGEVAELEAN